MRKRIIVCCGGAIATSTIASNKIMELCRRNGISVDLVQCRISEISSQLPADLILPTAKVGRDFGVPMVTAMPFISGVGIEKAEQEILRILKGE
ncbi:MAG: PTS galactitol transporter subunit IIB [Lachnospiraceae bacterium]|nr:PTS galactitol transporter subunit IIB [Lachnospiraceae bacterium]